jgi:hypothetical protein
MPAFLPNASLSPSLVFQDPANDDKNGHTIAEPTKKKAYHLAPVEVGLPGAANYDAFVS